MKKAVIFLLLWMPCLGFSQQGLYDISFRDIKDKPINMNVFVGKKLIVVVVNATDPDEQQLKMLDTLYRSKSSTLNILAIPVLNAEDSLVTDSLAATWARLNIAYSLSYPGRASKVQGNNQQSLLNWLTHVDRNKHFDNDAEGAGQMFVISEAGILYAVIKSKILPGSLSFARVLSRRRDP